MPSEQLAFVFGDTQLFACHDWKPVTRESLVVLVNEIKADVTGTLLSVIFFYFIFSNFKF
jgi:hypothetical protein